MSEQPIPDCPFKPGDVVQFLTGGPVMVVVAANCHGIGCAWMDYTGDSHQQQFRAWLLRRHEPKQPQANPSFKRGDLVYLKSGGPQMTIEGLAPTQEVDVYCCWIVGNAGVMREKFPACCLTVDCPLPG